MILWTVKEQSSPGGESRLLGLVKKLEDASAYGHGDAHYDTLTHTCTGENDVRYINS